MLSLLLVVLSGLVAQDAVPARSEASVRALPTFAAAAKGPDQTEVTVHWVVAAGQPGIATAGTLVVPGSVPEVNQFDILNRRAIRESPVRERDLRLAADDLVIVAVDGQGRELAWQRVKDPRIVRSEQPGPGGLLSGQVLYRREAELVIRLPAAVSAARVLIYGVEWNGREFVLRGLGSIPIPR